jgi:AcrR family transcriptional regulator
MKRATLALDPILAETFAPQMRKGDRKKHEILAVAVGQIARFGLTPATFEQIATELGTRRSHVAYYFATREDLFLAVMQYILAAAQRATVELIQAETTDEGRLRALVRGAFRWAKGAPDQARVFLLFHFFAATDPRFGDPRLALLSEKFREAAQVRIATILGEWSGSPAREAAPLAQAMHAEILGQLFEALSLGAGKALARCEQAAEEHCLNLAKAVLGKGRAKAARAKA